MGKDREPGEERAEATITEKVVRMGLGITSTLALFGCGTLLLLVTVSVLVLYLYSVLTGTPFKLE